MPTTNRRLIENWLPIKALSVESIRERSAASALPPINWLHIWWARRPLTISRAAIAAALLDANSGQEEFYDVMGTHLGVVNEQVHLDAAKATGKKLAVAYSMPRAFTHNLSDDERKWFHSNLAVSNPVILDATAGGGSIPFEAGRLGVRSIANELNPVATLILRATCQWPQEYGHALSDAYAEVSTKYLARVRELIAANRVYPSENQEYENEKIPTVRLHKYVWSYLWSRTVRCPDCGNLIPLSPNWRLDGMETGIRLLPDTARGVCDVEIVYSAREQSRGTVARGKAICPYPSCGATTPTGYLANEASAGRMGHQMYCVILKNQWQKPDGKGGWINIRKPKNRRATPTRTFRAVHPEDDNTGHINNLLEANRKHWDAENILPNEVVPPRGDKTDTLHQYGMSPWHNMFNSRQQLAHGYCVQAFREMVDEDFRQGILDEIRRAAWAYAALAFDKILHYNNLLARWHPGRGTLASTFDTHDFGMKWSYAEMAVAVTSLGLEWALKEIGKCIDKHIELAGYPKESNKSVSTTPTLLDKPPTAQRSTTATAATVVNGDARMLDLDDNSVDAVIFDPPYHNNVNYAELSDFFYVWLKRTAGYVLDDGLFANHLTDKVNEAIASPARFKPQATAANNGAKGRGKVSATKLATADYQSKMDEIFHECHRVIKSDGIMVVMFNHRSNDAWNAMIVGLAEAGFNITRTWPVKTEAESSLHIRNRAAARSTILLVCRPAGIRTPKPWHEVAQDIAAAVRADVEKLQEYDLSPVDTYLAAYGPALQVVCQNWGTRRNTANPDRPDDPFSITPMDALAVARDEVIAFRTEQLTNGSQQTLSDPLTWFYILAQDGTGSATMPFDEANLFARALGVELNGNKAKRILDSKNGKVTLKAATERMAEGIISPSRPAVTPLDQVHTALAIADRQNAEAARQWLEFNGHRWQDGEFRTAFGALRNVHKPGHPDEPAARALHTLLYEEKQPTQATLLETVDTDV